MSYIGHRCICGHPGIYHDGGRRCQMRGCPCAQERGSSPEVRPTFGLDGQPVERIIQPGGEISKGLRVCTCAGCKALYKKLTAA